MRHGLDREEAALYRGHAPGDFTAYNEEIACLVNAGDGGVRGGAAGTGDRPVSAARDDAARLEDSWRDTLALIGAASRDDYEGVDALLGNADLRAVAGMLAGVVLHHHHADGTDASRWAAAALPDAQSG